MSEQMPRTYAGRALHKAEMFDLRMREDRRRLALAIEDEAYDQCDALRAALERLLRATEFSVYEMDEGPGWGRVELDSLHPLIEAAEQARAALAASRGAEAEQESS
jgi:hypothetical protein